MSADYTTHYLRSTESSIAACGVDIDTGHVYLNFSRVSLDPDIDCKECLLALEAASLSRYLPYQCENCLKSFGDVESALDCCDAAAICDTATSKRGGE